MLSRSGFFEISELSMFPNILPTLFRIETFDKSEKKGICSGIHIKNFRLMSF